MRLRDVLVLVIGLACAGSAASGLATPQSGGGPASGRILYQKRWEEGVIASGSWSHQASDTLPGIVNGIVYGAISVATGSADRGAHAGSFSLPPSSTYRQGAMMLHARTVQNGSDEWFAMAYYFPSDWSTALTDVAGQRASVSLGCPNYYSVNSCSVSVSARPQSMYTLINSGPCPPSGIAPGCPWYSATPDGGNYSRCRRFTRHRCGPFYIVRPGRLRLNVWHEIVMHVYYTLDTNGVVQFWHRLKGKRSWKRTVSVSGGFPTLQTGPTAFGTTVTESNINGWPSTDQFGIYRAPAPSTASVRADNWCRATSFAAATRCFR